MSPAPTPAVEVLRRGIAGWRFSHHAVERFLEMKLTWPEVRDCLVAPKIERPSGPRYPEALRVLSRDRITLVVNPIERVVVTCLWWTVDDYTRGPS